MFSFNPPKGFLSDKTILITGASDGIGKCCALNFAKHGANLILLGRSTEKLEKIYDSIHTSNPNSITIHPLDFAAASISDYKQVAESIEDQYDRLDGLIHSAGMLELAVLLNIIRLRPGSKHSESTPLRFFS